MKNKKTRAKSLTKLAATMILSAFVCCGQVHSETDFTCFQSNSIKPIKLINPLYLDTEKAFKPVIKTSSSMDFNEADYFSSHINENEDVLEPEELKSRKNYVEKEDSDLAPLPQNNIFAPPAEEDTLVEREIRDNLSDTYAVSVDSQEELNLEGKVIEKITFEGLKILNPDSIRKQIKTQTGSLFNENLLQQDLQRIYASGFFTEKMSIEPEINENGNVNLKFVLCENLQIKETTVVGNTVISSMELLPLVTPLKNLPQNITKINEAIDRINECYHAKGYILAGVDSVDDTEDGNLVFSINEGIIDKILISGNEKTKDFVIERNIITQPGTVYNENYLKDDLARIYSTKIFKDVDRKIYPSETEEGKYNVKVIVDEDCSNNLSVGGGFDNALGLFGSLSYTESNLGGRGQSLTASGILGSGILLSDASIKNRMNYQLELSFFEPYFLNADNSLTSKLYYRDLGSWQVPLAMERRFGLNTAVEHKVKWNDKLTTNFGVGYEHISLSEGDFDKISNLYSLRNLNISERAKELTGGSFFNFAPGVRYNSLDSDELPREGILASAKFIEALSVSDFKNTNGRIGGSVTKYFPVMTKSSIALTARGGVKVHGDEMPEVMAFNLGGPYSVRGFRMNGVGTGDGFLMGSVELATPIPLMDRLKWDFFRKLRLTFFVDAGKVFDPTIASVLYDRPMSAITTGIGLKVYIPGVGPISVDYGIPLTNPGNYGSKRGYFTFGSGGMNGYGW